MASNHITKVAIVGAGGNSGRFMTEALLRTGKHTVTALTREGSQSTLPSGVISKPIDYTKPETIVEALKGQDAFIITLPGQVAEGTELKLVEAAGEAGVKWILNDWCPDTANEDLVRDTPIYHGKVAIRKAITDLGKSNYISISTGFWYEWSLAIAAAFGIDLLNHTATLFDEGDVKITTSTWPQVGRAVAGILSLPIKAEGSEHCLENWKNKVVYVKSFTVSQRDMLESVYRVTGTTESDWTITKQPSQERFTQGMKEMYEGSREGFAKMLYSRVFYPDGCGNVDHKGLVNDILNLPTEDIDEATRVALERAKNHPWS